jgi:hypothetical protein
VCWIFSIRPYGRVSPKQNCVQYEIHLIQSYSLEGITESFFLHWNIFSSCKNISIQRANGAENGDQKLEPIRKLRPTETVERYQQTAHMDNGSGRIILRLVWVLKLLSRAVAKVFGKNKSCSKSEEFTSGGDTVIGKGVATVGVASSKSAGWTAECHPTRLGRRRIVTSTTLLRVAIRPGWAKLHTRYNHTVSGSTSALQVCNPFWRRFQLV